MKRWAFIHPASGAIVMVTTSKATDAPAHLDRRAAPTGVDPASHWWNGWSFAPRIDAPIAAVLGDDSVTINCPAEAWLSFPDGSIAQDHALALPAGRSRVVLIGRHRGEVWIERNDA